jgi:hypothetical protein
MKSIEELKKLRKAFLDNPLHSTKKPAPFNLDEWFDANTPTIERELIQCGRCELSLSRDLIDSESFNSIFDRLQAVGFQLGYESHSCFWIIAIYLP